MSADPPAVPVRALLRAAAECTPDRPYALTPDRRTVTFAELSAATTRVAEALADGGVGPASRVLVGLANSLSHVAVVFALRELGAIWVPLNPHAGTSTLDHVRADAAPTHAVVAAGGALDAGLDGTGDVALASGLDAEAIRFRALAAPVGTVATAPGTAAVMYTSGTTGPAKGVQVTESMLVSAAQGCLVAGQVRPGDVLYVWEPMIHIGGAQVLVVPLVADAVLALSARFSVSRFWAEVTGLGATQIHYLGGILPLLLKRPAGPIEREHRVRVAWGAGATAEIWAAAESRFGLAVRECYGMTETSSIVTVNVEGPGSGVGRPLPWFDVELEPVIDRPGLDQIVVHGRRPGLITPGYLNRGDAGARTAAGGWRTGDVGAWAPDRAVRFGGRLSDSFRVRGENVSAWEVETVFGQHPSVARCAAVAVPGEFGEDDIMLFVQPAGELDPAGLLDWARGRLARYQRPRYLRMLPELPLTPSERVAKGRLDRDIAAAIEVEDRR